MFGVNTFSEAPFSTLSESVVINSAGVVAYGYAGTIFVGERLIELSGVSASGATGNLSKITSPTLVGVQSSGQVNSLYLRYWSDINQGVTTNWTLINTDTP